MQQAWWLRHAGHPRRARLPLSVDAGHAIRRAGRFRCPFASPPAARSLPARRPTRCPPAEGRDPPSSRPAHAGARGRSVPSAGPSRTCSPSTRDRGHCCRGRAGRPPRCPATSREERRRGAVTVPHVASVAVPPPHRRATRRHASAVPWAGPRRRADTRLSVAGDSRVSGGGDGGGVGGGVSGGAAACHRARVVGRVGEDEAVHARRVRVDVEEEVQLHRQRRAQVALRQLPHLPTPAHAS